MIDKTGAKVFGSIWLAGLLLLPLALVSGQTADSLAPDEIKRTWEALPEEERSAYSVQILSQIEDGKSVQQATGSTCEEADLTPRGLPSFIPGETSGLTSNYTYGTQCAGQVFNDFSGAGPDKAHKIMVDHSCRLQIRLVVESGVDLALFATSDCNAVNSTNCVGADEAGEGGTETLEVDAESFTPLYVIVDGFVGSAGNYTLVLNEAESSSTGCILVPVELQSFSID